MSPRWGLSTFGSLVFYIHAAPLGLLVGQDARPTEMGAGYGTRCAPATIDPDPTTFVLVETVLLSDLSDAPSRCGVSMSLYR